MELMNWWEKQTVDILSSVPCLVPVASKIPINRKPATAMSATPFNTNPPQDSAPKQSSSSELISRRDFLDLAWKAILSICGLVGFGTTLWYFNYQDQLTRQTEFDLGPAENYPSGSQTPFPDAQAILLHTAAGFQALSTVCPHLGCIVESTSDSFVCPCHRSRFNKQGELLVGPATKPLQTLRLEHRADDHLVLHTN
jgi:Rieske Fe-S protein